MSCRHMEEGDNFKKIDIHLEDGMPTKMIFSELVHIFQNLVFYNTNTESVSNYITGKCRYSFEF